MATVVKKFLLIGTCGQVRNDSDLTARVKVSEDDPEPIELSPGSEIDVGGDMILEVDVEE